MIVEVIGEWIGILSANFLPAALKMPRAGFPQGRALSERLELERQRIEDERRRAERALKLELLRQAGEREVSRLRRLGGAALASLFAALFLTTFFGAQSTQKPKDYGQADATENAAISARLPRVMANTSRSSAS